MFFSYPKEIKKDQKVDNVFSCIFSSILLFNSQQSSRDHVVYFFFFSTLDFFFFTGKIWAFSVSAGTLTRSFQLLHLKSRFIQILNPDHNVVNTRSPIYSPGFNSDVTKHILWAGEFKVAAATAWTWSRFPCAIQLLVNDKSIHEVTCRGHCFVTSWGPMAHTIWKYKIKIRCSYYVRFVIKF